ncbi:family 78 glycoside hydrolase catalytic domain, partial [Bacteroidota bacterium]
ITGLGYYEAEINGVRVGNNMLDPAWTNYNTRIFYSTYDVGKMLNNGQNCIAANLGNGWYNPLPMKMWGNNNIRTSLPVGRPCLIAQLNIEYEDGSKASYYTDESWKVHDGPILRNNVYLGEIYDARKEIKGWSVPGLDEKEWSTASLTQGPSGKLQSQPLPPIKITKTVLPEAVFEIDNGVYIFDMGENFAGWIKLKVEGEKGRRIKLRYGELLHEDNSLNVMTSVAGQIKRKGVGGAGSPDIAWQEDNYILKGEGIEEYSPRFTFHGFRYVEVAGYPGVPTTSSLTGYRLSSSVESVGSFECSNDMLNTIQKITQNTFLSNIFSVQSDCPHREKFGYGGDLATTCDAFMMNYDMEGFYAKAVYDWADAARSDGMLTDEAPFVGIQYCGVGWALVHPLLLNKLYQYYGNIRIVRDQYDISKKWFDLVISKNPDFIIKNGLSDHESLNPTPAPELVTPLYYYSAKLMSKLSAILDKNEDCDRYSVLAENIKSKYIEKFLAPLTGEVEPKTQTSQSFAIWLGLIPEKEKEMALEYLLKKIIIEKDSHLTTGIYATKFLFDILSSTGNIDLAYKIVSQKTFPGYGYMLENGATTLWEHWALSENTYSHNHPMFGTVSEWFYKWLGGIQPDTDAVGFDKIIIWPQIATGLEWVNSDYNSVKGLIRSKWTVKDGIFKLNVIIPPNSTAKVYIPTSDAGSVKESGKSASNAEEVIFKEYE